MNQLLAILSIINNHKISSYFFIYLLYFYSKIYKINHIIKLNYKKDSKDILYYF